MAIDVTNKFVVHCQEQLKDEVQEWAKVVTGVENAVGYVNELKSGFFGRSISVFVFKLGENVPLVEKVTEIPQPSKTTTVYELGGKSE